MSEGSDHAKGVTSKRERGGLLYGMHKLVSKFAGQHLTEHLIRAHGDVEDQVRETIRSAKRKVTDKFDAAKDEARQRLFRNLFEDSDEWTHRNRVDPTRAELWHDRSTHWLDHMVPQGSLWFEFAMETSVLDRDLDLEFACKVPLPEENLRQLRMDIPRTFPDIEFFENQSHLEYFERTLRVVAVLCPELGYVQGMNFLAGYLMLHCSSENQTRRLMVELMCNPRYQLRGVFEEGLPTLRSFSHCLKLLLYEHDRKLFNHLESLGFKEYFFAFQWISTVFAYSMPFDALQHVWSLFFEQGWTSFFTVCAVLIVDRRAELFDADFDSACAILKEAAKNPRKDFYIRAQRLELKGKLSKSIQAVLSK